MVKRLGILFLFGGAALLVVTGYWLLFTTFMAYDDEGYVLISLKNYSAHGGLYAEVYSQYGPFLYFIHDAGHRLFGYDFTNTNGRLFTLGCWLVAAAAPAHLVWRLTRSLALTTFTLGLTFVYLRLMISEPIHPGGLIAALVAIAAWSGEYFISRRALTGLAVIAGLLGAALCLTKINIGLFFLFSTGTWFVIQLRTFAQAQFATLFAAILLVFLPVGLMHSQWSEASGQLFIYLSALSNLTMVAIAWRERQPLTIWRHAGLGGGAFMILAVVIILTVCLRGTTPSELLEGILLGPLRHPSVYHFFPDWKPGAGWVGGVSLLVAGLVWRRGVAQLNWLLVALRLGVTLGFAFACLEWIPFTSHSFTMSYAVPLAWIFVLRIDPDLAAKSQPNPATWLGLLLVLQYLHAYPVAGTQTIWGTFLIVPLMALGLYDTQRFIARRTPAVKPAILGIVSLSLTIAALGQLTFTGWKYYTRSRPLQLPGAEDVRLPEPFSSALRLLALNATAHGDMLMSLPGMFSFNSWTDLPTPNHHNTTHWFSLLSRAQQEEIAAALTRSKRPVLIVQRRVLDFLKGQNFSVASPLYDYLQQNFSCVLKVEGYEFWIRRGREIARLGSAEYLQLKEPNQGKAAPGMLELILALPPGSKIARIEVATLAENPQVLAHWDSTSGPLWCTPITLEGKPLTAECRLAWNQPLPRLAHLNLPLQRLLNFNQRMAIVSLRDASGALLAEARFIE